MQDFMVFFYLKCLFPSQTILSERAPQSDTAWREFLKNMQSIIQILYFGQIRSTVKCRTCEFESATYEGFSHLSLELPQDYRQCQLHDCLDLYFDGEVIEGWTCPRCKQNRDAIKKLDISKLPPVLVIHLKRFVKNVKMEFRKLINIHFLSNNEFQRFILDSMLAWIQQIRLLKNKTLFISRFKILKSPNT